MVVTTKPHVAKQCNVNFGCVPLLVAAPHYSAGTDGAEEVMEEALLQQVTG